ncbi:transcriptional regulator, XRE family with cupin sensor [Chitinophaga terrae (ex Kim and Jung 2007)]|uniref:Transcriptional regulator, XRE family with cupin sensor n=1 Tax=Chitinophaga terrae (ex Kim and Jung 2007) TaxID=408074 RepID=A0A1H3XYK0_9BACT|nr:XRE family transcriptional regulator [Chitinophaga terrae (ex Kim and Jung 2007)]GEP89470.1 transcriptional regulator [Chitinophaga terrae (ex Kim and Jung 2007)]SEA04383.1 transcriptional regulator, XRE family with cupin sensor [Chitinophaga terrae (ex Kim and Jung 2007)]
MADDIIMQISNKIKEKRKAKGITIQELADRAEVSKGLISQIENNRTVPSLLVLINIIKALQLDMNEFFNEIDQQQANSRVIIKQRAAYQAFEKEPAKGFVYKRILTRNVKKLPVDIVLLELKKGASPTQVVKTDAYEYKYIIKGKVEYLIDNETYTLEEGDSLFFDGRLGYQPRNAGNENAQILAVYFLIDES